MRGEKWVSRKVKPGEQTEGKEMHVIWKQKGGYLGKGMASQENEEEVGRTLRV